MEPGAKTRHLFRTIGIHDRIIGVLAILGGIAVILGTLSFREIPDQPLGSAFFPRILGTALIFCGTALLVVAKQGRLIHIGDMLRGRSCFQVLAVLCSVILWVYLSPVLGFVATTAILIASLALVAGGRLIPSITIGSGMAIILFFVFSQLLRVPLPSGFIEAILT